MSEAIAKRFAGVRPRYGNNGRKLVFRGADLIEITWRDSACIPSSIPLPSGQISSQGRRFPHSLKRVRKRSVLDPLAISEIFSYRGISRQITSSHEAVPPHHYHCAVCTHALALMRTSADPWDDAGLLAQRLHAGSPACNSEDIECTERDLRSFPLPAWISPNVITWRHGLPAMSQGAALSEAPPDLQGVSLTRSGVQAVDAFCLHACPCSSTAACASTTTGRKGGGRLPRYGKPVTLHVLSGVSQCEIHCGPCRARCTMS